MAETTPRAVLEKVMEELAPLTRQYKETVEELRVLYEESNSARKAFLTTGMSHTRVRTEGKDTEREECGADGAEQSSTNDGDGATEEKVMEAYRVYKENLEKRVLASKSLLSSVNSALSYVDQQLLLLDSPYDPKFGIQTQHPRVFKTNKAVQEAKDGSVKYCVCNGPACGDMIACDAFHTESPWYHMECVNCAGSPRGHWLCPKCRAAE